MVSRELNHKHVIYYQPVAREARGRLVLRLLCCFRICWYVRPHLSRAQ